MLILWVEEPGQHAPGVTIVFFGYSIRLLVHWEGTIPFLCRDPGAVTAVAGVIRGTVVGCLQQNGDPGDDALTVEVGRTSIRRRVWLRSLGGFEFKATRYINPTTGQSVVLDDVTKEVIHVGGPGFKYGPGSGDLP